MKKNLYVTSALIIFISYQCNVFFLGEPNDKREGIYIGLIPVYIVISAQRFSPEGLEKKIY